MKIYRKETTVSTNADAHGGRHGDVFTADFQTAGRGRLDHRWESARGLNLMFSVVLDVSSVRLAEAVTLPLAVGLAVAESAVKICPPLLGRVSVKWPNDVLVDGLKLAGILCERDGDNVIAGVGINVNQRDFPEEISSRAVSLAVLAGRDMDRDSVLHEVLGNVQAVYERWLEGGFAAVYSRFSQYDRLKGRVVSVRQTDIDADPVSGFCGGVQTDGTLLVAGTNLYAGEAHVLEFR